MHESRFVKLPYLVDLSKLSNTDSNITGNNGGVVGIITEARTQIKCK